MDRGQYLPCCHGAKGDASHLNLIVISSPRLPYYNLAMIDSHVAFFIFIFVGCL